MMRIVLVTGGARAGKSDWAMRRASSSGGPVTFVASARADDEEMEARIARHRAERPPSWVTVEAPRGAGAAVCDAKTSAVVLDCLTLLASNALLEAENGGEAAAAAAVRAEVDALLTAAASREGTLIVVTNEVGLGVVPATPLGRWYRDALGSANRALAEAATEVVWVVSGIPVTIKGPV